MRPDGPQCPGLDIDLSREAVRAVEIQLTGGEFPDVAGTADHPIDDHAAIVLDAQLKAVQINRAEHVQCAEAIVPILIPQQRERQMDHRVTSRVTHSQIPEADAVAADRVCPVEREASDLEAHQIVVAGRRRAGEFEVVGRQERTGRRPVVLSGPVTAIRSDPRAGRRLHAAGRGGEADSHQANDRQHPASAHEEPSAPSTDGRAELMFSRVQVQARAPRCHPPPR